MSLADRVILDREGVEAARRRRLLTVGELVQRSGTSGKLIWRARTARAISLPKAKRVARVLRVSLASLVVEPAATGAAELTVREAFVGQVGNDERDGNAESGK